MHHDIIQGKIGIAISYYIFVVFFVSSSAMIYNAVIAFQHKLFHFKKQFAAVQTSSRTLNSYSYYRGFLFSVWPLHYNVTEVLIVAKFYLR